MMRSLKRGLLSALALAGMVSMAPVAQAVTVLSDDFNDPNGTLLPGKLPDVGNAWTQPVGGALTVQNGLIDTSDGARTGFGFFTQAQTAGERLTFDFTTAEKGNFFSGGFAGFSLFEGGTERVFIGDPSDTAANWGLRQSGLNVNTDVNQSGTTGSFTYDHRTGAYSLTLGGVIKSAGTIAAGFNLDRIRFINNNGGDMIIDAVNVDLTNTAIAPRTSGIAFHDDLNTNGPVNGRIPEAGTMWLQTGGGALNVQDGGINTTGGARTVFGLFNTALGADQTLTFDFETDAAPNGNFFSGGFAGISLFAGGSEAVFIGDPGDTTSGWGLRGSGLNFNSNILDDSIFGSFVYDFDSGAYEFYINDALVDSGSIVAGLAIDRFRIANNNGGDMVLSSVTATFTQIPEPTTFALLGAAGALGMLRRRRIA